MSHEDYAKEQLTQAYSRIAFDKENSARIKNWCITVWVGSLAAVNSNHLTLGIIQRITLPLLPIIFFWLLDAIQHAYVSLHMHRARKLEGFILGLEQANAAELRRLSLESGHRKGTLAENLWKVMQHAFVVETVVAFYTMLCLVTLLFSLLLK